ncbi:ATP synthase F0 subunit B [Paenibacillus sp. ISL-20]|uniref:ATP synthase F0 subunit B n=1 Tax=Paenibacillus sp. ISL-20 TaxID=2819163 RepID=UPI001BE848F0|nr:ATP synthase F0 subunit B [Paenibacillus sp. ISL-20]MBT2762685.1 hypothetical protein [Paenibacillus sp. ISL-20]
MANKVDNYNFEVTKFREEQQQILLDAKNEAKKMISESIRESNIKAEKIIEDAKNETMILKNDAISQFQNEKAYAMKELNKQVDEISEMIVYKVTGLGEEKTDDKDKVH